MTIDELKLIEFVLIYPFTSSDFKIAKAKEIINREIRLKEIEKSFEQAHGLNSKSND